MENNIHFSIDELAQKVENVLKSNRIQKWDLYLLDEHVYGLYLRKAARELTTDSRNLSYFVRIFEDKGDQMGIGLIQAGSANLVDIQRVVDEARIIAKINLSPKFDLIRPGKKYPSPKTTDKEVLENPQDFLDRKGTEIQTALKETAFVEPTFGKFRTYYTQKMLVNSEGLNLLKKSTYFCYEFSLKAQKDGKLAEYWPKGYLKAVSHLTFDRYIQQWATIARDTLRAQKPESINNIDVIFPPIIVRTAILNTLGYSATAQALFDKTSRLNVDEKVAVDDFTMLDDGLLPDGLNTSAWDGDGNPKQTTPIIEKGVMKTHLYDEKYARLLGKSSTGNATRHPEIGGVVNIEMNNLVIEPGSQPLREIMKDIKKGVYVDDFSWLNPDPITGMFGAEIRNAYWIQNGELGEPIKGGNLSGNVYEMIKNIAGISKETHCIMNAKVPFIYFKNLTLSGQ
jgi:predicted Zn-dependent protease